MSAKGTLPKSLCIESSVSEVELGLNQFKTDETALGKSKVQIPRLTPSPKTGGGDKCCPGQSAAGPLCLDGNYATLLPCTVTSTLVLHDRPLYKLKKC